MLNYVWLALLFLGIGTAVTTDLINQNENKYRNNESLSVVISFPGFFEKKSEKSYQATLEVKQQDFNSFYNENIPCDVTIPVKLTSHPGKSENSIYFKVQKSDPKIWQDMAAAASGEKDNLTGMIMIDSLVMSPAGQGSIAKAHIILENVSFLKIKSVTNAALDYAGTAVTIALGLIGIMALWIGIMKIAEEAGLIAIIASWLKPVTKKLFPEVPPDHPAMGSMIMNISANMLGLGNAATPFGLKAMEELDELNPNKGTATNAMCTFLAINTAGMTLIPATAIAIRAAAGSSEPAVIIGTSLFGSLCATVAGITAAKTLEKFPIKKGQSSVWIKNNLTGLFILLVIAALILLVIYSGTGKLITNAFSFLSAKTFKGIIETFSTIAIPLLIVLFVGYGAVKKIKVYEKFIEGAKEGFNIAVRIIPYLVAMLVAIGIFRAGGAMDWLVYILHPVTNLIGMPAEAIPMALMRPLSGSGSLGVMAETISVHGADSFIGILVSTLYGSSETTFYVLAVYFGAVNIKNIRHALPAGLIADLAGILGAVFIVRILFG
jgi:spore maturation protein SpmA